jgi:hypothetical protein
MDVLELDDNSGMNRKRGRKPQQKHNSSSGETKSINRKTNQLDEIEGPAAAVGVADDTNNKSIIKGISPEETMMMVLPHDIQEDEDEGDDDDSSNRRHGDELDYEEEHYWSLVPVTKQEQTTQSSNLGEEVECNNQEEDDGMEYGSVGCGANNGAEHLLLVPDLMRRVEQLEVENNNRLEGLERDVGVLRSQLEVERKINQNQTKLIEELVNHMRKKSRLEEQFLATVPYHLS